jgi:UDP-N-acetylmuramoyl-tripeptide--D-alanyl-D-alanine ligase
MSKGISGIIKYGTKENDHVIGKIIASEIFLKVQITQGLDEGIISTQLVGEYNLPNVLAAVTVGKFFEVPENQIKSAIENYIPSNSRSQLLEKDSNKIILDAYNANPSSMKLAIENFAKKNSENKILMLGAMAELGKESLQEHQGIIDLIKKYLWKEVVLVGGDFLNLSHPFLSFENSIQAKEWFVKQHLQNSYILVKGSRSMQMEKVLED